MTKARDLANIISGGFTASDIPNLDTAKITTGTLADARIPNLDTAKVTTGTFANARISAGSVTQHVTATDLTPVRQDLTVLGLKQAVAENTVAYNLPNTFLDIFQDDTGIGSETNVDRQTDEYITSVYTTYGSAALWDYANDDVGVNMTNMSTNYSGYTTILGDGNNLDNLHKTDGQVAGEGVGHSSGSASSTVSLDYGSSQRWAALLLGKRLQHGDWNAGTIEYSADDSTWTPVNFTGWSATHTGDSTNHVIGDGTFKHSGGASSGTGLIQAMGSDGTFNWYQFGTQNGGENSVKQKVTGFTPFDARYLRMRMNSLHSAPNNNATWSGFGWYNQAVNVVNNATGTVIGTANVPSSPQTKISGVMNYKDNTGTATIGTDLKIYFTCDGGSNWTEAAGYTAVTPLFSTGIKMVKLSETTCTSGSDVRYKAVWANQASGSKVTELHGIGINY